VLLARQTNEKNPRRAFCTSQAEAVKALPVTASVSSGGFLNAV